MKQWSVVGRRCAIYSYKMWLIEPTRWAGRGWWLATTSAWGESLAYLAHEVVAEVRSLLVLPETNQALLDSKCEPGAAQIVLIEDEGVVQIAVRTRQSDQKLAAYHVLNHAASIARDIAQDLVEGRRASPKWSGK